MAPQPLRATQGRVFVGTGVSTIDPERPIQHSYCQCGRSFAVLSWTILGALLDVYLGSLLLVPR